MGQEEETFISGLRDQADHALSTRILLESIAAVENWEVTDEDLITHVESMLEGQPGDPQELVDAWRASGEIETLTGDILRERAITSLVDSAKAVDTDGNPVDLTPVVTEEVEDEGDETEADAAEVESHGTPEDGEAEEPKEES
jgi:trigger factor